jgi:replicative DNA helicase
MSVKQQSLLPTRKQVVGKALPSSIDAEKSVLGALLLNDEHITVVSELLVPADFYLKSHHHIYQAILNLSRESKRLDLITLQDELVRAKKLDEVGGEAYLVELQEDIHSIALVLEHAKLVKEKAVLRQLINSASTIITSCYEQDNTTIDEVLDSAEKTIFNIVNKRTAHSFVQLNIWLQKTFKHLSDIKSHTKGVTGTPSGYKKLDALTSGFQAGDLVVLAARPSMGKTALSLSIAAHAAHEGFVVGFFSLEMSAEQLTLRLLSSESGIPHHHIRNATISSEEWIELTNVAARMAEMNLFIDDSAMLSIGELRAKARKLRAEQKLDFLVIDYLQLLHSNRRHENRHQEVSEISRSLKALAKELGIPVVALSQLSRAVDSRMDKRPILSDLRESGAIEQDADVIMFLYRDVIYNSDAENPASAELIIGKQRNGPTGTIHLHFERELTRFESMND